MNSFAQNSSIVRNLVWFIAATSLLFLLDGAGLYFSSRTLLSGLADIHEYNLVTDKARQIQQIADSRGEILERISVGNPAPEAQLVLKEANGRARAKVDEAIAIAVSDPQLTTLLATVKTSLLELEETAQRFFRTAAASGFPTPEDANRQILVLKQLDIESRDAVTQIQIYLQRQSSLSFEKVYGKRQLPLQVVALLTVVFVIFSLFFGLSMAKRIKFSIQNFLKATSAIAGGDSSYRAPIIAHDELGLMTHAFNTMAQTLRETTVSKNYVENILGSMSDMVLVLSPDGKIQRMNEAVTAILGYGAESLHGRETAMLFAPSSLQLDIPALHKSGRIRDIETKLVGLDGTQFPALVSASVILGRDDKALGLVCVAKDITVLKQAEDELRKKSDELQLLYQQVKDANDSLTVSNKELESFSYSVSHDLRAPLRGIDGFSQALLEDNFDRLDEQGKSYLKRVRAATQRMGRLIDDLIGLAKVTRNELVRRDLDLSAMVDEIGQQLKEIAPAREIDFIVESGIRTHADPGLIRIVMENLLGNAFKFTAKKQKARIEFGTVTKDAKRVFFLKDDGAGFDMAYADKLFGVFQRMHAFEDFAGTGIGLATTSKIVARHGGKIWAESAVGQGATFYFVL